MIRLRKKSNLVFTIFIFLILSLSSCTQKKEQNIPIISSQDVSILTPQEAVILYFQAWNDEQYDVMYSLISDGFKEIDPTAKTFSEFKTNVEKFYDTSTGVGVLEAKEAYNNGKEAGVNYKIKISMKSDNKKEFSGTYTLKKRENGWKLIHPYGENIDTS